MDFEVDRGRWNRIFKGIPNEEDELLIREIKRGLDGEYVIAEKLRKIIEDKWSKRESDVLFWLKELTGVGFKEPTVRVCVVPFNAGQTPFKDISLIIVGKIRKGWDYPETIAHELAHILFNQNFTFDNEIEHPYIQLIEEEIAVRLGARSKYFDYEIPAFAEWVHKAKEEEHAWRHYRQHIEDFKDLAQFIQTRIIG